MRPTRNKTNNSTAAASEKIIYPPNCKEIGEDLSTDDLVRRLKDISMAFQQLSQDDDNNLQYIPLALTFTNDYYLEHSSENVRLLVACSIADVFRVYAPHAPYQDPDLIKKIFKFFIHQLKGLENPKEVLFKRYFYLLENLACVKSFNICIDLDDAQAIFCELFTLIFSIVNENHSHKVKNFMVEFLSPLILESDSISPELMEIIFMQLIEPKKSQSKYACLLAREIVKESIKTLGPYLVNYLATAVTSEINGEEPTIDSYGNSHKNSSNLPTANYFRKNIIGICDLIYELNKVVPDAMRDFLPQLEYKIKTNDERERCEFTRLLARLFSDKESNLANEYPQLWKSFLGRFKDISATVRIRCVQYSMHFLVNHPEMKADVTEQLKQRQHDQDENVRHEVVMAIISAARKGMDNINEELLEFVKERSLDKKFKIRREALYGLAQLYRQYILNIKPEGPPPTTDDAKNSVKQLTWIKNKCLHNYYQTSLEDKLLVERIVHTCLIPCSLPLEERVKTLYSFYVTIDAHASRAFNEMLRQQQIVRKQVCDILDVMKEPSGAAKDAQLKQKVQICSRSLLEPVKTEEYILKLINNMENNTAHRDHLELIVSSANQNCHDDEGNFIQPPTCSSIEQSVREILRSLGYPVQTNSFYMIIKNLMERIAPIMIDHEGILQIFNYVHDSLLKDGELDSKLGISNSAKRGLELILSFAHVFPTLFYGEEPYEKYLLPFLWQGHSNQKVGELVLQILAAIGSRPFSKPNNNESSLPFWAQSAEVIPKIIDNCILNASSPKQAKYAVQCLNAIISSDQERDKIYGQILDSIKDAKLNLEKTSHFRAHLVALGMIATCGGQNKYSALLKSIINVFVVRGLLMIDTRTDIEIEAQERSEANLSTENFDFEQSFDRCSEEIKCKIEGIKLIVRWIHGMKLSALTNPENNDVQTKYTKTAHNLLQLCKTIIQNNGDLNEKKLAGSTLEKAHLRLAAANAMIRIVANDSIAVDKPAKHNLDGDSAETKSDNIVFKKIPSAVSNLIGPQQLHILATTIIDEQDFVRDIFTLKLHKKLISLELGLEFLAIFSLGGKFPQESAFRKKLQTYLLNNLTKRRELIKTSNAYNNLYPDCTMPFVIHLLAHMPFYTRYDDTEQLEIVKECLWFIMEPMVFKNENYSFTFFKKTFESIKTCIDKTTAPEDDAPLSASAQLINYKIYCACDLALGLVMSKTQNFALRESPIKPQLHSRYYTKYKAVVENNHKCYLPESMQFPPPKRCGLETEQLSKTNKKLKK